MPTRSSAKKGCWPDSPNAAGCCDYRVLIKKITTISKTSSRNVLITKRIGTIASNFDLGAAMAGGAIAGGFGAASAGAAGTAGGGGGAILGAAGGAIGGIGGAGGKAKGAGAGGAACGGAGGGSAAGVEDPILEIIRVNSPGPELTGIAG